MQILSGEDDNCTLITTDILADTNRIQNAYFLGSWCFSSRHDERKARNAGRIFDYHWNDRAKLKCDFQYLQLLNEGILDDLVIALNEIHCVSESKRFGVFCLAIGLIYILVLFLTAGHLWGKH